MEKDGTAVADGGLPYERLRGTRLAADDRGGEKRWRDGGERIRRTQPSLFFRFKTRTPTTSPHDGLHKVKEPFGILSRRHRANFMSIRF